MTLIVFVTKWWGDLLRRLLPSPKPSLNEEAKGLPENIEKDEFIIMTSAFHLRNTLYRWCVLHLFIDPAIKGLKASFVRKKATKDMDVCCEEKNPLVLPRHFMYFHLSWSFFVTVHQIEIFINNVLSLMSVHTYMIKGVWMLSFPAFCFFYSFLLSRSFSHCFCSFKHRCQRCFVPSRYTHKTLMLLQNIANLAPQVFLIVLSI